LTRLREYKIQVMAGIRFKVVELSTVSEETIEDALNTWTAQGFQFEGIHFVVRDASRRPSMAFVTFTMACEEDGNDHGPQTS